MNNPHGRATKRRPIMQDDGTVKIPLTKGQFTLIDADDLESANQYRNWHLAKCGSKFYAVAAITGCSEKILLHRLLLNAATTQVVDHLNGDGLDNRRANIKIATGSKNNHNRAKVNKTGFRGVSEGKDGAYWVANIRENGKTKSLGCFDRAQKAAMAYDEAALRIYGQHALTNFPREFYGQ